MFRVLVKGTAGIHLHCLTGCCYGYPTYYHYTHSFSWTAVPWEYERTNTIIVFGKAYRATTRVGLIHTTPSEYSFDIALNKAISAQVCECQWTSSSQYIDKCMYTHVTDKPGLRQSIYSSYIQNIPWIYTRFNYTLFLLLYHVFLVDSIHWHTVLP